VERHAALGALWDRLILLPNRTLVRQHVASVAGPPVAERVPLLRARWREGQPDLRLGLVGLRGNDLVGLAQMGGDDGRGCTAMMSVPGCARSRQRKPCAPGPQLGRAGVHHGRGGASAADAPGRPTSCGVATGGNRARRTGGRGARSDHASLLQSSGILRRGVGRRPRGVLRGWS